MLHVMIDERIIDKNTVIKNMLEIRKERWWRYRDHYCDSEVLKLIT